MFLLALFLKSTIVLGAAVAVCRILRRRSPAATIHLAWVLAFAGLLALPLLSLILPAWFVPFSLPWRAGDSAAVTASQIFTASSSGLRDSSFHFSWMLMAWLGGVFAALIPPLVGAFSVWRITRRAKPFSRGISPVPMFTSDREIMPMVWGLRHPGVLLPASARQWTAEKLRIVLLHELAHIDRRDLWTQILSHAVTALYWFHPLAWHASRQMRRQSEMACDDLVLRAGVKPSDYATELLEVARSLSWRKSWSRAAFAMARPSNLEGRLLAILDARPRSASRRRIAAAALALFAVVVPSAALQVGERTTRETGISGNVYDASGGLVADAAIAISGPAGVLRTNAPAGSFAFDGLPPGLYRVEVEKAGFAPSLSVVRVAPGPSEPQDFFLNAGSMRERLTVTAQGAPDGRPKRLRIGGNMQAAKLISRTRPLYPQAAKLRRVSGTVIIRANIRKDGTPEKLTILASPGDDLSNAALEAVSKWRYSPTLLNGEPIDVETIIDINFTLRR
ncbi:MAG: M56 family metallopeptidase [Bryobacteraceae bacterium]